MAEEILGPEFWVHGGGLDLVFPHHENERAQSCSLGRPFAKVWAHNGMLRFTGEKMSKSVGNIATIQDVLAEWGRETALLFFLTGHWRKPIDFSEETMARGARAGRDVPQRVPLAAAGAGRRGRRLGRVRRGARGRLQHADRARDPPRVALRRGARRCCAAASTCSGSAASPRTRPRPAEVARSRPRARRGARRRRTSREADRLRDAIAAAGWDVRDVAGDPGYQLVPRA